MLHMTNNNQRLDRSSIASVKEDRTRASSVASTNRSSVFDSRRALTPRQQLRKSKSLTTVKCKNLTTSPVDMTLKRRSTGCIKQPSYYSQVSDSSVNSNNKGIWRPPGFYEIPNVFGPNCFLKSEYNNKNTFVLREESYKKPEKPWYNVGSVSEIPQLPPLVRSENEFERKLRSALSHHKIQVSSLDPDNKYNGSKEIGTGVNGSVVRTTHRYKKNLRLAIKKCRLDPDREYRAAIIRELRIMSYGHSNLIRLREVTLWRDVVWMAMDLMNCSVFAVLCKRGIPEEHTINIACEALEGLKYLHQKGFIHRDIKCENILLGFNGEVKLADFGLATRTTKRNKDRLGTSKWMSPEVIREECYDEKIDMWSLGITIIEMMDRVPPHYTIKDEVELFTTIVSEPSPTFTYSYPTMYMRGLVAWLLDEIPSTRPSAKEVLTEIKAHVDSKLLKRSNSTELARFVSQVLN